MISAVPVVVWPFVVLAVISAVDGILCIKPVAFIRQCFLDVGFPERWWRLMPVLKFASAVGLIAGIWIPWLTLLVTVCLVAYFIAAIGAHIRAQDFGRNLFVNAFGMLAICVACLVTYLVTGS